MIQTPSIFQIPKKVLKVSMQALKGTQCKLLYKRKPTDFTKLKYLPYYCCTSKPWKYEKMSFVCFSEFYYLENVVPYLV